MEGERRKGNRDNGEPSKMIYMQENGIKKSTTLLGKKSKEKSDNFNHKTQVIHSRSNMYHVETSLMERSSTLSATHMTVFQKCSNTVGITIRLIMSNKEHVFMKLHS